MNKFVGYALASATLLAVTACGGGGDSTPTPPASVPLAQALRAIQSNGYQKTLNISGTASNGTQSFPVTGSLQFSASGYSTPATFNGQAALSSTQTINGSLSMNGQTVPFASTGQSFVTTGFLPLGGQDASSYCVVTQTTPLPTSASVGTTGTYSTASCYTDSTKGTPAGTETVSYTISAGTTSSNLTATEMDILFDTSNKQVASVQSTYLIDTTGTATFQAIALAETQSGVVLSLTGQ